MVDEDRYCIDILTQIAAVKTALEPVGARLLEDHVTHCVARRARLGRRGCRRREDGGAAHRRAAIREDALVGATARSGRRAAPCDERRARSGVAIEDALPLMWLDRYLKRGRVLNWVFSVLCGGSSWYTDADAGW